MRDRGFQRSFQRRRGALALVLGACGIAAGCASAGSPAGEAGSRRGVGPRDVALAPYLRELRVVDVTLAGHTHPFLLDTGGGLVLVTPKVAQEIGCQPFGRLTGFRNDGGKIEASRCGGMDLAIAGWPTHVDEVAVFDVMSLLSGLPEVGGLIGLPAFERTPFTLDLAANRLTLETPVSLAERVRTMKEVRVRSSRQAGGASLDLFVAIDTPRGPIWLELDSGNIGAVLLSPPALAQLGVDLADGASRELELSVSGLGPVKMGALARDTIYDGLLDAQFLQRVVVTADLAHERAWMTIRPAPPVPAKP